MLRHKHGAAILKRQDRGLKRTHRLCSGYDLFLVKPDQRTENGQIHRVVGNGEALNGLARDLTDRLARDERSYNFV